jgi:hypothetical protein
MQASCIVSYKTYFLILFQTYNMDKVIKETSYEEIYPLNVKWELFATSFNNQ